jgi:hypothetical protein
MLQTQHLLFARQPAVTTHLPKADGRNPNLAVCDHKKPQPGATAGAARNTPTTLFCRICRHS